MGRRASPICCFCNNELSGVIYHTANGSIVCGDCIRQKHFMMCVRCMRWTEEEYGLRKGFAYFCPYCAYEYRKSNSSEFDQYFRYKYLDRLLNAYAEQEETELSLGDDKEPDFVAIEKKVNAVPHHSSPSTKPIKQREEKMLIPAAPTKLIIDWESDDNDSDNNLELLELDDIDYSDLFDIKPEDTSPTVVSAKEGETTAWTWEMVHSIITCYLRGETAVAQGNNPSMSDFEQMMRKLIREELEQYRNEEIKKSITSYDVHSHCQPEIPVRVFPLRLTDKENSLVLPAGEYKIGKDLPAGTYSFSLTTKNSVCISAWGAKKGDYSKNGGLLLSEVLAEKNSVIAACPLEKGNTLFLNGPLMVSLFGGFVLPSH